MNHASLKENLDAIQQKARERTVKTQTIEYDLETLVKRISSGTIKLDPEYQRRHRWSVQTSSRLIESLILNIPIPVIFISQDVDVDTELLDSGGARYTVIDGQQRLTAIYEFIKDKLVLDDLETLSELNGSRYSELPPFLKRRLDERTIRCLRIDSTVDAQVKYDIFERLNTGSVKLEAQELRNAVARGPFNDLTKELAELTSFRSLLQVDERRPEISVKVQKMEDVELVLRFFALKDGRYNQLRKGFRDFLTDSLVDFNRMPADEISRSRTEFKIYMDFIDYATSSQGFSKWRFEDGREKKMSNFNAAVYDAVAVGLSQVFSPIEIEGDSNRVEQALIGYRSLFADPQFFASVSGSVNDAAKVKYRIDAMIGFLRR